MNKTCPSCKREIDENEQFCPFCAAFVGEQKEENNKKSRLKTIIGCTAGVAVLGTVAALVFAFDVFGLFTQKVEETLPGTGDRLFVQSVTPVCVNDKWGYIDPTRWNAFYNWLNEKGLTKNPIPENTGFSNDYLE